MRYYVTTQNMGETGECSECVEEFRASVEAAFGIPVVIGSEADNEKSRNEKSPNSLFPTYGDWENNIWDSGAADCGKHS